MKGPLFFPILAFLLRVSVADAAPPLQTPAVARSAGAARASGVRGWGEREELFYRASWNGIPVASAKVEAAPLLIGGKKFYHVRIQARTWEYLDPIWRMRDSVESLFEAVRLEPHRFVFRQRENRKRAETTALFDPEAKTWRVRRENGPKLREYEFFSPHALDPVSAAYVVRGMELRLGDVVRLEVFGGRSRYLVHLRVASEEKLSLNKEAINAYKLVPEVWNLSRSGYAGRLKEAAVWLSADERRIPLRVESRVFIGSVAIELEEIGQSQRRQL